jgi:hypothetical protein
VGVPHLRQLLHLPNVLWKQYRVAALLGSKLALTLYCGVNLKEASCASASATAAATSLKRPNAYSASIRRMWACVTRYQVSKTRRLNMWCIVN